MRDELEEGLVLEIAVPFGRRTVRSMSVSAVPVGPGAFLGSMFKFLDKLLGGWLGFCLVELVDGVKCGHHVGRRGHTSRRMADSSR